MAQDEADVLDDEVNYQDKPDPIMPPFDPLNSARSSTSISHQDGHRNSISKI